MMCPDYRTPYILKCKHEQEIEQAFVFVLDTNICLDYDYYCKRNNGNKKQPE